MSGFGQKEGFKTKMLEMGKMIGRASETKGLEGFE